MAESSEILVVERWQSRSGDQDSIDLTYTVSGTDVRAEAAAAVLDESPTEFDGLRRDPAAPYLDQVAQDAWHARVTYTNRPATIPPEPATGDSTLRIVYGQGSAHITEALSQTFIGEPVGDPTKPMYSIGVTDDGVEGVDVVAPGMQIALTKYFSKSSITQEFLRNLYLLSPSMNANSLTVSGSGITVPFGAGECLYVGAELSARYSQDDIELSYILMGSPSKTIQVPSIQTIGGEPKEIEKRGWDYIWFRYVTGLTDGQKLVIKRPVSAFVAQVYPLSDFSALNLPT